MNDLNSIKLTPRQILIAVAIILLILSLLGLRLYFDTRSHELAGPEFLVSNNETAVLVYNNTLYRLDPEGNINQQFPLTEIAPDFNSADIQLLDNQRFAIADWNGVRIYLCEFTGPTCQPLTEQLGKQVRNHFKFFYREAHREIFIADTDRHRVIRYDTATNKVSETHAGKAFIYPNHLQMEADGYLYLTDTNHHRIGRYKIENNRLVDVHKYSHVTSSTSSNKWPIFYTRLANDDLYILQGNDELAYADLVLVKKDNVAEKIPLPQDADITVTAMMNNELLLLDRNLFAIHALNLKTHTLHAFGSPGLSQQFARGKSTMQGWADLSDLMMVLMILTIAGMVGFIVYLALRGKREIAKAEADITASHSLPPVTPGKVTWLDQNPFLRKIMLALLLTIILISAAAYAVYQMVPADGFDDKHSLKLTLSLAAMIISLVLTLFLAITNLSTRIGTDGAYIFVRRFGHVHKLQPREIMYNRNNIVCNNLSVTYRNPQGQYFYDKDQFERYILPLLTTHASEAGLMKIFKHKLHNPGLMDLVNLAIIVGGILLIYFMYQHDMLFS